MPLTLLKRRRWIVSISIICLAAIAVSVVARSLSDPLHARARRQWKDQAITRIQGRLSDKAWLDNEISRLNTRAAANRESGSWVGDELLVAKNGDWIICQNVCSKGQDTPVRKDLFIGCGSDGKWYYSTFHFCVQKCVLQMERQPDSLAQLVNGHWLAPFHVKSGECLKVTWDGGPFGEEKLRSAFNRTVQ